MPSGERLRAIPSNAMVLTAGLGTRLRPLTLVRAKPAVPVAGIPLARRIIRWLAGAGVTELVLNLHHLPDTLTRVLGDGTDLGARVRYSWEDPAILGSAGGPARALDVIGADTFFIVNGDTLSDVDLACLYATHRSNGAQVTLALVPNREPQKYGGVRLDGAGRVTGFARKGSDAAGSFHFVGVQVAEAAVFRGLAPDRPTDTIGGVYDALIAAQPGTLAGHLLDGDGGFRDIGTVGDYWATSRELAHREGVQSPITGHRCRVDPAARIGESILWDDVTVQAGATLQDCIVTDGVTVSAGAAHQRAVLVRSGSGYRAEPF